MNDDQHQPRDGSDAGASDDTAFVRLQAADPARGSDPDLTGVFAAVSSDTGVPLAEQAAPVDELAARRARRAPRWLQAAAVVAGIAVIGGGSYAYGSANAGSSPVAGPAMTLSGGGSGLSSAADAAQAPESAPGAGAAASDSKIAGWGFGRTVFASEGLSTAGGMAPTYGFDAPSTFTQDTMARVAAALGVAGEPRQEYGQWIVGSNDGTAANASISPDGMTSVSYSDPTRDPWNCVRSAPEQPVQPPTPDGGVAGSTGSEVAPDTCRPSSDPAPTGDAAVSQAKDTMSALGVDPTGFEFEASTDPSNPQYTSVSAYQVIDDQRSGASWSFTIVASGVQSLYGSLAPTVALGDYSVVSPTEAVARLSDPRFGSSYGGVMPLAAEARDALGGVSDLAGATATEVSPAPSDEPTVPAVPAPGSPLAWPVQHVTIVSARLGLALTTLPSGASVLAPTYELADADGTTWTVIAVADDDLDFTS